MGTVVLGVSLPHLASHTPSSQQEVSEDSTLLLENL